MKNPSECGARLTRGDVTWLIGKAISNAPTPIPLPVPAEMYDRLKADGYNMHLFERIPEGD